MKRGRGKPLGTKVAPFPVIPLDGLKRARLARGETQVEGGARIGVTKSHYAKIEAGTTRCDIARLAVLARAYGVTLESFLPKWADGSAWPPPQPRKLDIIKI